VPVRLDGDQGDVLPYYAAADIFALPSRSEGSPNALLEAMAAGAPIVAAAVGGIPEIVEHGVSAALVAAERPMELRDAIVGLLAKPGLAAALGAGARHRAAGFSRDARHAALREIYERVMPLDALVGAVS
jgi:glycosyltransferase involved in cell wall biosynthesis